MVYLHHTIFECVAMVSVWLNWREYIWPSYVDKPRRCLDTMAISVLEHLNPNQKQDDQKCKSLAFIKKNNNKKNCWTLTYQNTWFNWVLADHLTSLANPCVVSRAFTSPFFLTSCSLHFEVTVPWYDKQTEPTSCSTSLEVYWCSILSLPVPFLPASHQWSPWPHSSNLWPHILLGHSTDEELIFIEPHHLGFVSRLGTSML